MGETATHSIPAWRSRANFLIRADLADHGLAGRMEQLWARKIDNNTFEICCIPFFTYGIALGDMVETDSGYFIRRVTEKGGHRTLRGAVANKGKVDDLHESIHRYLDRIGLMYEWYAPGYFAVDLPSPLRDDEIVPFLQGLATTGDLSYEIDAG
jgi:hypothetical protein